jgi:hypothetical protein
MLGSEFRTQSHVAPGPDQQRAQDPVANDLLLTVGLLYPESRVCQVWLPGEHAPIPAQFESRARHAACTGVGVEWMRVASLERVR